MVLLPSGTAGGAWSAAAVHVLLLDAAAGAQAALVAVRALKRAAVWGGDGGGAAAHTAEPATLVVACAGCVGDAAAGECLEAARGELAGLHAKVVEEPLLPPLPLEGKEADEAEAEDAAAGRPAEGTQGALPTVQWTAVGPEALLVAAVRAAHSERRERKNTREALAVA